jgi:arylformamidase
MRPLTADHRETTEGLERISISVTVAELGVTAERYDDAYLPGRFVPSVRPFLAEYARRSARARRELEWRSVCYGPDPGERLHVFPAPAPGAPLVVFVHGGYWQELSEGESSFAARDVLAVGAAYAAIGYGLAPRLRLGEMVTQVRRAVLWLCRNASTVNADPRRVVLVGHSAGAHLVCMSLVGPLPDTLTPRDLARAAVLISGLYELAPLRRSSIGSAIGLTAADVAAYSPVRHLPTGLPPLLLARAAAEPAGFGYQQHRLAETAVRLGVPVTELVVGGRNHFDLPLGLADPTDPLGRAVLDLLVPVVEEGIA